jgi:endonuclease YncB( thermonuclease family)
MDIAYFYPKITGSFIKLEEHNVTRVIDGDTIVIDSGEKVRLLGINTPEKSMPYYEEAKNFLVLQIENKTVSLEKGRENKDKYDRLLRYIFINKKLINEEIVKNGLANTYLLSGEKYDNKLKNAENFAKTNKLGLWNFSIDNPCFSCFEISGINYDAKGDDCKNVNDEYITLSNNCNFDCNTKNVKIKDTGRNLYAFKNINLLANSKVILHSGAGKDNSTDIFWLTTPKKSCMAIWNNDHDSVFLLDSKNNIILFKSY